MIGLLLAALTLPVAQDTEQLRVKASTEASAVQEFANSCMAGYYERASVERTVPASPRKYRRAPDSADGKVRTWLSNYGTLQFVDPEEGQVSRCTMTAFTASRVDARTLGAEISDMLKGKLGRTRVRAVETDGVLSWTWEDGYGNPIRLMPLLSPKTPQQILFVLETVQRS